MKDLSKPDQPGQSSMHHSPESRLAQSQAHFREHIEDLAQHYLKLLLYKMHFHSKGTILMDFGLLGTFSHQG